MTDEEKAEFIKEIKAEFKPMINDIAFSHVAPVNKKLTYRVDGLIKQTEKNFIKMKDKFEEDMLKFSTYCKGQINNVRADFEGDIKSMKKLRARDRSDYDIILTKQEEKIEALKAEILRHSTYFEVFANSISLLTENINMQMESEFADISDRNLMSLYAIQNKNASIYDHKDNEQLVSKLKSQLKKAESKERP